MDNEKSVTTSTLSILIRYAYNMVATVATKSFRFDFFEISSFLFHTFWCRIILFLMVFSIYFHSQNDGKKGNGKLPENLTSALQSFIRI